MREEKTWTKVTLLVTAIIAGASTFLPWATASGYGRTENYNFFHQLISNEALRIITITIITVMALLSIIALFAKKRGITTVTGALGICIGLYLAGYAGLTAAGIATLVGYGASMNAGVGCFLMLADGILMSIFAIIALAKRGVKQ